MDKTATIQEPARTWALAFARRQFDGRKGHGQGRCSERHLSEAQLAAMLAIAYQAGANATKAA